jgi:hypothetical protein
VGGAAAHCRAALAVAPPRMITSSSMALSLSRENPLSLACCRWNKKQSIGLSGFFSLSCHNCRFVYSVDRRTRNHSFCSTESRPIKLQYMELP